MNIIRIEQLRLQFPHRIPTPSSRTRSSTPKPPLRLPITTPDFMIDVQTFHNKIGSGAEPMDSETEALLAAVGRALKEQA